MSFNCEILADSKSPQGHRITTMKITFPRFILAEFNTHRMFSRNSASSRAIPFSKMVKMVEENPFIPIAWQKDHKGMQGTEYLTNKEDIEYRKHLWLKARNYAIRSAKDLSDNQAYPHGTYNPDIKEGGVTKQLCNRLLEPFMWHTVIVTATDWENFFNLRCPQYVTEHGTVHKSKKDFLEKCSDEEREIERNTIDWLFLNNSQAEIHIQAIAELMWDTYNESVPNKLKIGEWHIPKFHNGVETLDLSIVPENMTIEDFLIKVGVARCARISYETLGDNPKVDYGADIKLHDMLLKSGHMSPFEHIAKVMNDEEYYSDDRRIGMSDKNIGWSRNFRGFIQYRSLIDKS
jgi:thymidylate synthase ThyX